MFTRNRGWAAAAVALVWLLLPLSSASAGPLSTTDDDVSSPCTITGTEHNDILRGTPDNDVICAYGGNDIIFGNGGNDRLYGGPGRDTLVGGAGYDQLYGGEGDDLLVDTLAASWEDGEQGSDRCIGVRQSAFRSCEHAVAVR
jgi:Ca2+-binding RTX toxin-like protein